MDLRMQGLDPPVEHFRKAGVVADLGHGQAGILQQLGGAAGGQEATPRLAQLARKFDDAGLVGNADQGLFDGHHGMSSGW